MTTRQTSIKKRVFSGIQPTGNLHIGNYIGAISIWAKEQQRYDGIFSVVDLHALTIPEAIDPVSLQRKTREVAALLLACGIDPKTSILFIQSHVSAHAELAWILNCVTPIGWLERMTQYKSKATQLKSVSTGLLNYPVLQAADILLYQTDLVPVGEDQKQHIELSRDIAQRFNHLFGDTFTLPQPHIRKSGARIMGLDDPDIKMSKSIGAQKEGHAIGLLDALETIRKSIMRAVTDSGSAINLDCVSPGIQNLLVLYETLSGKKRDTVENRFAEKGYGHLKQEVADLVIAKLKPIQKRFREFYEDPDHLDRVLAEGAMRACAIATPTLEKAKRRSGLG